LILENIGHHSGNSAALKKIITEIDSPQLKANFDTANPLLFGEDPRAALGGLLVSVEYEGTGNSVEDTKLSLEFLRSVI
jgi:hypothetical protein